MNYTLILGSLLGFSSIAFSAFLEHSLKNQLNFKIYNSLKTAVFYQQIHSLVIVLLGLILFCNINQYLAKKLKFSASLFAIGIFIFSFSIYLSVLLNNNIFIKFTPYGGVILMFGWLFLGYIGFIKKINK